MLKKLELDSLKADLASVNALLAERSEETDPIGWYQFHHRKQEIEQEIREIQETEEPAGVGLFFGGQPVLGSRGILAEFAGKAVKSFQDIITKRFASLESGPLGTRGPVPMRGSAQLMITDIVRGSFGFLLQEASDAPCRGEVTLREVIAQISELVRQISSEEENQEAILEALDNRILLTLKEFFQTMDESMATLRVVRGSTDYLLGPEAIRLARSRLEVMQIAEREDEDVYGRVFILPHSRRFELYQDLPTTEVIRGNVSVQCLDEITSQFGTIDSNITGHVWHARIKIREIREGNKPPKASYTLMQLLQKMDQPSES